MRVNFLIWSIVGFSILGYRQASAQTNLTLKDAVKYALANSEVIRKANLDIENGLQVVKETRASAYPQISAVSNLTVNPIVQQFVLPAEAFGGEPGKFISIKAGQTWNAMTTLQVRQQIYNQQLFTGLKAAKGSAEFYNLMKEVSEENVIQQVATNYYQILLNHHKLGLLDDNLGRLQQLQGVLQGLLDNGMGRKLDVDRVKVNRVNLETQKTQLLNAIELQKNVLKYYMAMPQSEEIILPEEDVRMLESRISQLIVEPNVDLDDIIGIKVLKKQNELLGLNEQATRSEFFPTLSLSGQYVQNTQSNKFNLYTGKALNYNTFNFTFSSNIPIFDGGAKKARLEKTRISLLKNNSDLKETSEALRMAYSNAKIQLKNSIETVDIQKANLALAEEVFENTSTNYKLGLVGLTDLLNAESELFTTQSTYNEALLQFKVAEIELTKAKGQIRTLAQ